MPEWLRVDLWRPGYQLALVLALLALAVAVLGLVLARRGAARRRAARVEPAPAAVDALPAPGVDALAQSFHALQRFDELQARLRERLDLSRHELEAERASVTGTVALMKRAALEMRLPHALFELYEGLRLRPRKPPQAQAEDLAWHRRIGVSPGGVLVFDEASRHARVEFELGGRPWRIAGRSYALRSTAFDELTLFDAQGRALITARVRLSDERTEVLEASVQSYRPGDWVDVMLACRLAMDERREELLLALRHRDVDRMRADFGLRADTPVWGSVQ